MRQQATSRRDRFLLQGPGVRAEAREATERARRARASSARALEAPWYPVATLLLLTLGVWTFLGAFILGYPYTAIGQNSVLRVLGAAIVLMVCGLWIRHVGFSAVAVIVAGLVGAALLWSALELPHEISRIRVNEGIIGALVLIACGVIAATARPRG
jgi:hypothetical protein